MTPHLEQRLAEIAAREGYEPASEYVHAMRLGAMAALEWQPIETAPMDGSHILVCIADLPRSQGEAFWWQSDDGVGGWQTWDGDNNRRTVYTTPPTHWMPLPPPPKEPSDERD